MPARDQTTDTEHPSSAVFDTAIGPGNVPLQVKRHFTNEMTSLVRRPWGIGRWAPIGAALLTICLPLNMLGPGCGGGKPTEGDTKVFLLGIDALEWRIMNPLLRDGRLPNFSRLVATGSGGNLLTLLPLTKSPIIWTSIATGKNPDKHGIGSYLRRVRSSEPIPMTSNARLAKALWNILSDAQKTVGVVGWWVTWPAEPANGFIVSDYFHFGPRQKDSDAPHRTYPEELLSEIESCRVLPEDVDEATVRRLVDFNRFPTGGPTPDDSAKIELLKRSVAQDLSYWNAAVKLYPKHKPDFFTVYFKGIDDLCHIFWGYRGSDGPFGETIERYYEFTDERIGPLIAMVDSSTTLIICSDHGFTGGQGPGIHLGVKQHGPTGVIMFNGPHVRPRTRVEGATVVDIAPTILNIFGLPVGEDMDGIVLQTAFNNEFIDAHRVTRIPTYEMGGEAQDTDPIPSPYDQEMVEKLRALGYIK